MTKEQAELLASLFAAFVEGKALQKREKRHLDITDPCAWRCKTPLPWENMDLATEDLDFFLYEYRIKPEAKKRQFKDGEECWQEMQKHQPFGWVTDGKHNYSISDVSPEGIGISGCMAFYDYGQANSIFRFIDGAKFGISADEDGSPSGSPF